MENPLLKNYKENMSFINNSKNILEYNVNKDKQYIYDENLVNDKNLLTLVNNRKAINFEINNYYYILDHK